MTGNLWLQTIRDNPGHSDWYIERFRAMAAEGADLDGEARFVDAMVSRGARILDAGCGPGRLGGRLAQLGHTVVGVDIDPALIAAAEADHPGPTWLVGDLADFELDEAGSADGAGGPMLFDAIVSAGNVMTFLDPTTRVQVLANLRSHLADDGRLAVGFGAGRGYDFDDFWRDAASAGLREELRLSTWDLRPFDEHSGFLVALLTR